MHGCKGREGTAEDRRESMKGVKPVFQLKRSADNVTNFESALQRLNTWSITTTPSPKQAPSKALKTMTAVSGPLDCAKWG